MRIGSFWGLTGPMFVLAFPQKEDAIPYFHELSATVSGEVLSELQKELIMLLRVRDLVEYKSSISISEELSGSFCRQGVVNDDTTLSAAFEREFIEKVLVRVSERMKYGEHVLLDELTSKVHVYLKSQSFQVQQINRYVKQFVQTLPASRETNLTQWLKQYPLQSSIVDSVLANGTKRALSEKEKTVVQYYVSRCDDIEWWIDALHPGSLNEETIFGVPFFSLIKRKPESLRYAVLNMFEYIKKSSNAKVLNNIVESVSADISKFRKLYSKYVSDLNSADGEVLSYDYVDTLLSQESEDVKELFSVAINRQLLSPSDYLESDFKMLIGLGRRISNLSPKKMCEIFGFSEDAWNQFGEQISEIGICGINSCSSELFLESLQQIVLSTNKIYRSSEVIKRVDFIVTNELEALINTIIPVGEVI